MPNQAHVRSVQENRCEITLSGIYIQSNADAGSHEAGRMMVSYLRHFLAGLCRLNSGPRIEAPVTEDIDVPNRKRALSSELLEEYCCLK
jgi:hypothetical protein